MFLFVSDLHLQKTAWKNREDLAGDSFRAWKEIVEYAIIEKAAAVVLGGDNLDEPRPSSEIVQYFMRGMKMLEDHDIPVFFIQGQHCRANPPWPSLFGGIRLDGAGIVNGIKVGALDNMPAAELRTAIEALPRDIRVLMLHQMCKDAPCVNWDFDPQWVSGFEHLELILMGDLHVSWEKSYATNWGLKPKFIYGGSCAMQSKDEACQKSFLRVETKKDTLTATRIPLQSRPKLEYLIESDNDVVAVDAALRLYKRPEGAPDVAPLVVVTHSAGVPVQKLREIHPGFVFMFKPLALMTPAPEQTEVLPSVVSLEKNLDLVVTRDEKPELHSFLLSALTAEDARHVVEAYCVGGNKKRRFEDESEEE